ncbi:MAG: zinc-binding dehydrogenase [Sedimentisphaerales bacterium]|nr:zinc-binding dehydrogenase [Sedimentisphaerales bacterium]
MKAAMIHKHGGVDCVTVGEFPDPKVGEGDVVLEVRSAALNHLDIWIRKGRPGVQLDMPHVLGSDGAGVIAEVGPKTHGINIGDEVIVNPGLSCGCCESCRRGQQSECLTFGIVGMSRPGTFAEKVAVPFQNVYPKPDHLSFDEAAALPLAYQTAWRMLMTRAGLRAGETVLIHGIGGGVALAGLQLAKLAGAEVIVTSSSDEKLSRAKAIGADHVVNYQAIDDLIGTIKDITKGCGVDIVMDSVGAATWSTNFGVVRRGGRIVLCGVTTGLQAETDLRALYWNQLTVMGSTMGSNEDVRQMLRAVEAAKLKPVMDSVKSLEEIRETMSRMEAGEQFGKIVVKVT